MTHSLMLNEEADPEDALKLPEGRLMVGELMVTFSPENVVDAARSIITHFDCKHGTCGSETFVSQAGIIAYAANETSWNGQPRYRTV